MLGLIENMSEYVCPKCDHKEEIFDRGHVKKFAQKLGIPFLGEIPIDPLIRECSDKGEPYILKHAQTPAGAALSEITRQLDMILKAAEKADENQIEMVS